MAHIGEYLHDGRLQCGGVNHPQGQSRDTMYFLEKNGGFMAFGCKICTEIHRTPQLHFLAASKENTKILSKTRKAEKIERNEHGTIISFR